MAGKRKQVPELPLSSGGKKAKPVSIADDDDEEERKAEYRKKEQEKARQFIQNMMGGTANPPTPSSKEKTKVAKVQKPTPNKKPTPTPNKKKPQQQEARIATPPLPASPDELLSASEQKKLRMDELRASAAEEYMRNARQSSVKVTGVVLKAESVAPRRRVVTAEPFVAQTASVTKASFLSRTDSVRSNECDAAVVPPADEKPGSALRPKTLLFALQIAGLAVLIWLVQTGHFDVRHLRSFSSAYRYIVPVCVSLFIVFLLFCFGLACRQLMMVDYSNPQKNYENLVTIMGGLTTLATLVTVLKDLFLSSRKD